MIAHGLPSLSYGFPITTVTSPCYVTTSGCSAIQDSGWWLYIPEVLFQVHEDAVLWVCHETPALLGSTSCDACYGCPLRVSRLLPLLLMVLEVSWGLTLTSSIILEALETICFIMGPVYSSPVLTRLGSVFLKLFCCCCYSISIEMLFERIYHFKIFLYKIWICLSF